MNKEVVHKFLERALLRREQVDGFLDFSSNYWAYFDSELGYLLRSSTFQDGIDDCWTFQNYVYQGERKMINFPDQPCRINTYGNSFTQGAQVSDGETWQEILAAHFGEPIRNFGIGGHGFYHAWKRLQRIESTEKSTDYVILNTWGDDHLRSVNCWRWLTYFDTWDKADQDPLFHGNPWDYLRLDSYGNLLKCDSKISDSESLYRLCDLSEVIQLFGDDLVVQILAGLDAPEHITAEFIEKVSEVSGQKDRIDVSSPEAAQKSLWRAYCAYAVRTSILLLSEIKEYVEKHGKQLLILLSYPFQSVVEIAKGIDRHEEEVTDWHPAPFRKALEDHDIPYIDTLYSHLKDFQEHRLSPDDYVKKYYIGHYNPEGNQFFARAIREELIRWLDPAPPAYRDVRPNSGIRFEGYLPNG